MVRSADGLVLLFNRSAHSAGPGSREAGCGERGQVETEEGRRSLERVRGLRYEGCVGKKSKWLEGVIQAGSKCFPIGVTLVTRWSMLYTLGLKLASCWPKLAQAGPKLAQVDTN